MIAKRSADATKKLSLHGQTSTKSVIDNPIVHQAVRRNSRRISVDVALQVFSSHRRRTVHTAGHGVSDRYSIDSPPLSILYTSKAVRAYRQKRALHHKEKEKKKKDGKQSESNEGFKQTPLERFRKAVRLVIILRSAFKNIVIYASQKGRHEQITSETTLSLRANTAKGTYDDLLFDPEEFKSQFKDSFPLWAKHVADKDPNKRTSEEVKLLVRLMKQLKGFRRYSPDVQTSLCRVLKYDQFGRRRVIIRKGHIAQRLYFIFSGSVCVTDDEDEDSAFANTEDEKACLKRGDYFGELAFLKKLKRAATIVCLEQTEFLSVSKEDFFVTGIDSCFTEDLEKRILFLSNHPLFVTWPRTSLVHIAEVSRVHAYHSDDVIVKNSSDCYWMYFITKGQANVLRLVDLQRCPAYQKHLSKTNAEFEAESSMSCYPSKHRSTALDTLTLNTFPIIEEDEENEDGHQTIVKSCHSDMNIPCRRSTVPRVSTRSKSAYARSSLSNLNSSCQWSQNDVPSKTDVGVGVYMGLDRLTAGQLFGGWSVIQQEDQKDRKRPVVKDRRLILLSGGCEVIKMPKKDFCRDADSETIEHLRQLATNYPSDNKLCQAYLRQSDWRCYREELVDDIIERKQAIKQGTRRTIAKPTPAVSPLCSVDARHYSFSAWEHFRGTSWVSSRVPSPVVKNGKKRRPRRTPTPHQSRVTPVSRCSQRAGSSSRYPLNPNPLVGEKLVVAKGSHRSLVLTHGGIRCNDYIEKLVPGVT